MAVVTVVKVADTDMEVDITVEVDMVPIMSSMWVLVSSPITTLSTPIHSIIITDGKRSDLPHQRRD